MTYQEILDRSRDQIGPYCKSCKICNGMACKNTVPGPGAKGLGTGFIRNYQKWQELCVNMDTICENGPADTSFDFFGHQLTIPVMAGPVGAMQMHYGDKYDDLAIAMDIDGAGLPFLKNLTPPAGSKTVEQLKEIADYAGVPFILKGIMTVKGAEKAVKAGAKAIIVSNHGGRVLDQCPATAEVLPAIADAVGDKMTILVDGGIRTGMDVFKALALGADAVLIGRPFVNMVYGGGAEGVQVYVNKLKAELEDTMAMCGAHKLSDIKRSMIFGY